MPIRGSVGAFFIFLVETLPNSIYKRLSMALLRDLYYIIIGLRLLVLERINIFSKNLALKKLKIIVSVNNLIMLFREKGLQICLGSPEDKGVNVMCALISINSFKVHEMPDNMKFINNTITPMHISRHSRYI